MIKIKDYVRVGSLEEAYELNQKRSACILGGMLWTKMGQRQVQTAIDLSGLGLDWIELMILALSILFSAWVTIHNQKEDMRVTLEKKPIWLRWIALYALLFYVILLGKYGPGYSASEFIYQNFKV